MGTSENHFSVVVASRLQEVAGEARHNAARNRAFEVDAHGPNLRPSLTNSSKNLHTKNLRPYRQIVEIRETTGEGVSLLPRQ